VKSRTTAEFRKSFAALPKQVQEQAREAYRQFKENPSYPSLRFKKVHPELPIYSARISNNYRAVGQLDGDTAIWFWVGSHADYDRLLSQL
jgi:mRNA-degrading endonuclease RelE of RelBE toxin-antitoxin system